MKILTIIFSYNSKSYTERILKEFNKNDDHDIVVCDNSNIEEEIPNLENLIHIGPENVNFGGMIDAMLLKWDYLSNYDYIGFLNNDTFGWSNSHIKLMKEFLTSDNNIGIYHHSISRNTDKAARTLWPVSNSTRLVDYIENVAPYYSIKLLDNFRKFVPVQRHGLIDIAISGVCKDIGMKQIIDDRLSIEHIRSGVRKKVGSMDDYLNTAGVDLERWQTQFPQLRKYNLHT